jgi:hypothetical protein
MAEKEEPLSVNGTAGKGETRLHRTFVADGDMHLLSATVTVDGSISILLLLLQHGHGPYQQQ